MGDDDIPAAGAVDVRREKDPGGEARQALLTQEVGEPLEATADAGAAIDPLLASLGTLTIDQTPLLEIARNRKAASLLVDKVGFDN